MQKRQKKILIWAIVIIAILLICVAVYLFFFSGIAYKFSFFSPSYSPSGKLGELAGAASNNAWADVNLNPFTNKT